MKVRITLVTENDSPVSNLGNNPEKVITNGWNLLLGLYAAEGNNGEKGYVEKVEILE